MGTTSADPEELRFTQFSIADRFQDSARRSGGSHRGGGLLDQAVADIQARRLSANEFPSIRVVRHQGSLWSLDNRRLWVFRKAKVSRVMVRIVQPGDSTTGGQRFSSLVKEFAEKPGLFKKMSKSSHFPRVRLKKSLPSAVPASGQSSLPLSPIARVTPLSLLEDDHPSREPIPVRKRAFVEVFGKWPIAITTCVVAGAAIILFTRRYGR